MNLPFTLALQRKIVSSFAFIEEVVEAQEKLREMRKVYEAKKKMETA